MRAPTSPPLLDALPTTRRGLLTGAAALAVSALGPCRAAAQGSATPYKFTVGAAEVTVLSDGEFSFPLGFVLPGRPEAEVETLFKQVGSSFGVLEAQLNVVLIRTGPELVLIDTGAGPDLMPTLGRLADRLEAAGFKPDEITAVVFTHAHADHLWGVIDPLGGGTLFEKARHVMSAAERDFWLQPGIEGRVSDTLRGMAMGTRRRLGGIAARIETVRPGQEIAPGLSLVDTAGHTPGHVSVLLNSGGAQLLVGGDALVQPVVSFAAPKWRWGSDMDTDRAIKTRLSLLDRLANETISLVGTHLPWPGLGRVERKDSTYRFVPA